MKTFLLLIAWLSLSSCWIEQAKPKPTNEKIYKIDAEHTVIAIDSGTPREDDIGDIPIVNPEQYTWTTPSGDGCNSCTCSAPIVKRDGKKYYDAGRAWCGCTLMYCPNEILMPIDEGDDNAK